MNEFILSQMFGVLIAVFKPDLNNRFHKWRIKRNIKKASKEFSKHIIWAKMQEENVNNIMQILSGFNTNMAYKIIECSRDYSGPERKQQLNQIINIWLGYTGVKTDKDREYAMSAFNLFVDCIMKVREKSISNADRVLKSMLEQYMNNLAKEIEQEINKHHSITKFIETEMTLSNEQTDNLLYYRSGQVPFCGRQAEFIDFSKFCNCEGTIKWWALIAPGGSGKSRLAFEYCKAQEGLDWDCLFLDHAVFDVMDSYVQTWQHSKNLLIVIDYVSINAKKIGNWLRDLSQKNLHGMKIRILFIERNGFMDEKEPLWFEDIRRGFGGSGGALDDLGYTHEKQYILQKLSIEDKKLIIKKVVLKHNRTIDENDTNTMIEMLEDIDNNGQRPLFLLFIIQAYVDSETSWRNWNREDLQQHIYRKEVNRIKDIVDDKAVCIERAKLLWAFASLAGSFNISDVINIDIFRCDSDLLFSQGLTEDEFKKQIAAICGQSDFDVVPYVPDIAGEFFILETLYNYGNAIEFIKAAWKHNSSYTASIFDHLYSDYRETKRYRQLISFQKGSLLYICPQGVDGIVFYAMLVVNISSKKTQVMMM